MKLDFDKPTMRDRIYAVLDFIAMAYVGLCVIAVVCIVVYALV